MTHTLSYRIDMLKREANKPLPEFVTESGRQLLLDLGDAYAVTIHDLREHGHTWNMSSKDFPNTNCWLFVLTNRDTGKVGSFKYWTSIADTEPMKTNKDALEALYTAIDEVMILVDDRADEFGFSMKDLLALQEMAQEVRNVFMPSIIEFLWTELADIVNA